MASGEDTRIVILRDEENVGPQDLLDQDPDDSLSTQLTQCHSVQGLGEHEILATPSGEVRFKPFCLGQATVPNENHESHSHGKGVTRDANYLAPGSRVGSAGKSPRSGRARDLEQDLEAVRSKEARIVLELASINHGEHGQHSYLEADTRRAIGAGHVLSAGDRLNAVDGTSQKYGTSRTGDPFRRNSLLNYGEEYGTRHDRMAHERQDDHSYRLGDVNNHSYRNENTQIPNNIGNKKPATYDGKTSLQDYLVQFEMISDMNGWNNTTKAMELVISLRGTAQTILSDIRPELRKDYDHLVKALTDRFEPSNQSELYRCQIKSRLRNKTETLSELGQEIKRLVRMAYPQATIEVREQLAKDSFIDALNDSDLQWPVRQGRPETVDDAVQLALEYESYLAGRKRTIQNQRQVKFDLNDTGTEVQINDIVGRLAKIENAGRSRSNMPPNNPKHKQSQCYSCGETGHWRRECPHRDRRNDHPYNKYHNYQAYNAGNGAQNNNYDHLYNKEGPHNYQRATEGVNNNNQGRFQGNWN